MVSQYICDNNSGIPCVSFSENAKVSDGQAQGNGGLEILVILAHPFFTRGSARRAPLSTAAKYAKPAARASRSCSQLSHARSAGRGGRLLRFHEAGRKGERSARPRSATTITPPKISSNFEIDYFILREPMFRITNLLQSITNVAYKERFNADT